MFLLEIINIHRIFAVLGQPEGDLFKKTIEFILLFLIVYMIISEYSKDSRRDLKYLIVAFIPLAFVKFFSMKALIFLEDYLL